MEFFFEEHLRLDWGLGNPNKTAALIACLLVLTHLLRHRFSRKSTRGILFSICFLGLGVCLIHTYSRGGIVAAIMGQIGYWAGSTRGRFRIPLKADLVCGTALALALTGYACLPQINATKRYTLGVLPSSETDRSITNRVRIWKDAPRMMVDAPKGWGMGNSGQAWTQWYQPLSTRYEYRTLVNSHLTWLVEFGWIGRFFYLFAWGMIFSMCFNEKSVSLRDRRRGGLALGIWMAFAAAACFSSVAEAWQLWILPAASLAWVLPRFFSSPPGMRSVVAPAALASIAGAVFLVTGLLSRETVSVSRTERGTVVGNHPPEFFLFHPDHRVVGRHYGHLIRQNPNPGWLISDEYPRKGFEKSIKRLILSGIQPNFPEDVDFQGLTVYLNPLKQVEEYSGLKGEKNIILGELRRDSTAQSIRFRSSRGDFDWRVDFLPGKKVYLGNWIAPILDHSSFKSIQ